MTELYDIEWEQVKKLCGIDMIIDTNTTDKQRTVTITSSRFKTKWVVKFPLLEFQHRHMMTELAIRQYIRDSKLNNKFGEIKI